MSVTAVVGSQWGDEAKGKFVDVLADQADIIARYNGGDNAGHTVVNPYGTFKMRLTPNGLFNPKAQCVIGPGVVINLATLIKEIEMFQNAGVDLNSRLWISPRCNVVMPYHPLIEAVYEQAKGHGSTGTTGRGIGPVFADKVSYNGIRLFDLQNEKLFAEKLRVQLDIKNRILQAFGKPALDFDQVYQEKLAQFAQIREWVCEPFGMIQEALAQGKHLLLEGAQGALLDNIWGTYPFCTASTTLVGGASAGVGIAPQVITRVIAVAKAYTTRVGSGPMPTELHDEVGRVMLHAGQEFGTVTGRARRCGWFDANLVRFTSQVNGATELALTKLDVLDALPTLRICTGYHCQGTDDDQANRLWQYWEGDAQWLQSCEPVYIEMEGWQQSTKSIRDFAALPAQAKTYIHKIEELVGVPVKWVSVGPGRDETIHVN